MKNKALYIGLGVAALAVVGFFAFRKKQGSAEDMETRSADVDSETDETEAAKPAKGQALSSLAKPAKATAPTSVSTPKAPTTSAAPAASSSTSNDILFLAYGITQKDYEKMDAERERLKKELEALGIKKMVRLRVLLKGLSDFAIKNNISAEGYSKARAAKTGEQGGGGSIVETASTTTDVSTPRRDCRAEAEAAVANTPRILRAAKKLALIAKCKAEGGFAADGGDEFAFSFADDTYDVFS
jgi:hypothetical protein